jgi:adenylosuccinate synthase
VNGKKTVLHLIPSGILHKDTKCYISSGVVLSISALNTEIKKLEESGVVLVDRLFVAKNTPLILSIHAEIDKKMEEFTLHSIDNIKHEEEKIENIMKFIQKINSNNIKVN